MTSNTQIPDKYILNSEYVPKPPRDTQGQTPSEKMTALMKEHQRFFLRLWGL